MSLGQRFVLVEPFDWRRFDELQEEQRVRQCKIAATRPRVTVVAEGIKGSGTWDAATTGQRQEKCSWADVYVGEMHFDVRAVMPDTALFETPRDTRPHNGRHTGHALGRRVCKLLFYQRHVFMPNSTSVLKVVPIYGLRVADAFALQYNWNRWSHREYFDGNSVRARLLHDLDDACGQGRPQHAMYSRERRWHTDKTDETAELVCSASLQAKQLRFSQVASAVVLLEQCPIRRDAGPSRALVPTKSGWACFKAAYGRASLFKKGSACAAPATVMATQMLLLKAIAVATGYDCDPGHTDKDQDIMVDFQVHLGCNNYIRVADLCAQLAKHNLNGLVRQIVCGWRLPDVHKLFATAASEPAASRRSEALAFAGSVYIDRLSAQSRVELEQLPLHLLREVRIRSFDVTQDVAHLHSVVEQSVFTWRADKRYRFKSRKYEKQTAKPTGKVLLVQTRRQLRWREYSSEGGETVNHKYRKNARLAKRNLTRKKKRFWQNRLLDEGYVECGVRKPKAGMRQTTEFALGAQGGGEPAWPDKCERDDAERYVQRDDIYEREDPSDVLEEPDDDDDDRCDEPDDYDRSDEADVRYDEPDDYDRYNEADARYGEPDTRCDWRYIKTGNEREESDVETHGEREKSDVKTHGEREKSDVETHGEREKSDVETHGECVKSDGNCDRPNTQYICNSKDTTRDETAHVGGALEGTLWVEQTAPDLPTHISSGPGNAKTASLAFRFMHWVTS